jgi:general stress protein YciG
VTAKPPKAIRDYFAKLGRKGAKARAHSLTPERRAEIARAGGKARAAKLKAKP